MSSFNRTLTKDVTTYGAGPGTLVRTASTNGDVVIGFRITNTTASAIKVCAFTSPDSGTTKYYLVGGTTASTMGADVPVGGSMVIANGDIDKLILNNGDKLYVFSSAATSCDVVVSVLEN